MRTPILATTLGAALGLGLAAGAALADDRPDIVIAVDVVGAPTGAPRGNPTSMDLLIGASQIMMESIIEMKLRQTPPQILLRPPVSHFGVLDFLKVNRVLEETAPIRDELKRAVEAAVERHLRHGGSAAGRSLNVTEL